MAIKSQIQFDTDLKEKKITVVRDFDAPVADVWRAWTERELLDQWWAPKPWRAETKKMDFSEGGHWVYAMVGPDNSKQWVQVDFHKIDPQKVFHATDFFIDENGLKNSALPEMKWKIEFIETGSGTRVKVELTFDREEDLHKIMEMGFQEGFTSALENLDQYFLEN